MQLQYADLKNDVSSFVWSNNSNVFRAMLEEKDMKEKETKQMQIDEAGGESVKEFVNFLYTA